MSCPVDHAAQRLSPTGCPISGNAAAFDPFSLAYQRDPAGTLAWAREQEPVFYSPELGYWVVTRYDDVKAVFRDNILFSPSIALEKITPAPPEAAAILQRYGYAMNRTMVNEDIYLQLFCDDSKSAEISLIDLDAKYVARTVTGFRGKAVDALSVHAFCAELNEDIGVHLMVHDYDDLRGALQADARGRSPRGDAAALNRLLSGVPA